MFDALAPDWRPILAEENERPYIRALSAFLSDERKAGQVVYPAEANIFRALERTPLGDTRVVILGQDPYHGAGQANGLAFSVHKGVKIPPSLRNIYKEIEAEYNVKMPAHGDLEGWARQGVLLLNATLTVRQDAAGSHQKRGWEEFTDAVIRAVNDRRNNVVFMLWGSYAQKKGAFIDRTRHMVIESAHPSPLSAYRGFLGSGQFLAANDYLGRNGLKAIDWTAL